jgi:uncharacterized protein (DUF2147 family)
MKNNALSFILLSLLLLGMAGLVAFVPAANPDAIVGTWLTGSKKGRVQIYKEGSQYFGKIVWIQDPVDHKTNRPLTDSKNPDAQKRGKPLLGLVNLRNFSYDGGNEWDQGKVYDPENGKEYSCKLTLRDPNTLDVRGYVGISIIGRTDTWRRVNQ